MKKNNFNEKIKVLKVILFIIVLIAIVIICLNLINKETITKLVSGETSGKNVAREKNEANYTAVMSLDGIEVPVPTGYVASSVESEMYVNGIEVEHKGTAEELTFTSDGTYPWTQNEDDGVWVSGNKGVNNSTSTMTSNEITIGENGGHLTINWSVSSTKGYDILYATVTNIETGSTEGLSISGTDYHESNWSWEYSYDNLIYTTFEKELEPGTYTISVTYSRTPRSYASASGLDSGYVKSAEVVSYNDDGDATVSTYEYGGFVIYEGTEPVTESNLDTAQKTRNQWVWVPVEDASRIYTETNGIKSGNLYTYTKTGRSLKSDSSEPNIKVGSDREYYFTQYGLQGMTDDKFYQELRMEYEETIESIKTYGGFYIGRYETGNLSQNVPVVQKFNTDIANQTWYTMYGKMGYLGANKSVKSNMIWGSLWNETLEWLVESGSKTYDGITASAGWANYKDVAFTYTTENAVIFTKLSGDSTKIPTGSTEYTKANNIYDMAGNVAESTLELSSNGRSSYGGSYDGSNYGADDIYTYNSYTTRENTGCRAYLYIK